MAAPDKPKLISFKLCPFVRRSVITLNLKKVDYDIEFIDLANKPDWFVEISPLGKVPVLKVGDEVLFESAVINEYLDEVNPPSVHPEDPLVKARHRAMIEFSSALLMDLYVLSMTKESSVYEEKYLSVRDKLRRIDGEIKGPFFDGEGVCLIDTALAPAMDHIRLVEKAFSVDLLKDFASLKSYSHQVLQLDAVKTSVVDDFEDLWMDYYKKPFHAISRAET